MSSFGDSKSSTEQKGTKLVQAFQELLKKLEVKRASLLEATERHPVIENLLDAATRSPGLGKEDLSPHGCPVIGNGEYKH
jgi:hypothetical protein